MTRTLEKYRELYLLAKEVYNSELDRFDKIDDKAAKYLSSLTFVIAMLGLFGKWLITEVLPPSSLIEWLVVVAALATLASLILSWFFLFRVLRLHTVKKLPLSDETVSLFKERNLATALYAMTKGLKNAHHTNRETVDEKVKWLHYGYRSMIVSGTLLLILMLTLALHSLSPSEVNKKAGNLNSTALQQSTQNKGEQK